MDRWMTSTVKVEDSHNRGQGVCIKSNVQYTRSSGCYAPLLLAPEEGWLSSATIWGPLGPLLDVIVGQIYVIPVLGH